MEAQSPVRAIPDSMPVVPVAYWMASLKTAAVIVVAESWSVIPMGSHSVALVTWEQTHVVAVEYSKGLPVSFAVTAVMAYGHVMMMLSLSPVSGTPLSTHAVYVVPYLSKSATVLMTTVTAQ
jgi:hypothetical protein